MKDMQRHRFNPWLRKMPWRRKWQPTQLFLLRKFHGQRSLMGCSSWGCKRIGHNWVTKQQHPPGQSILVPGERFLGGISPHVVGKRRVGEPQQPVWTVAACATEDSHGPWTRVVTAVRPAPRGPNAELFGVGLPRCLALPGARAAIALCTCQVPGCGFVLSNWGSHYCSDTPTSPSPGCRLLWRSTWLIFQF